MVIGNYMEKRCKIININTGKEREVVDNSVPCKICDRKFDPLEEGVCGVIGQIPVLFCTICMTGIVDMVEYLNLSFKEQKKKDKDETDRKRKK